jgi:hypothetical protein
MTVVAAPATTGTPVVVADVKAVSVLGREP